MRPLVLTVVSFDFKGRWINGIMWGVTIDAALGRRIELISFNDFSKLEEKLDNRVAY